MSCSNDGFSAPEEEIPRVRKWSENGGYTQVCVSKDEPATKAASSDNEIVSAVVNLFKKAKTGPPANEVDILGYEMPLIKVTLYSVLILLPRAKSRALTAAFLAHAYSKAA